MSRSYNHRNKDNTDSAYLKHYFAPSSFRGSYEEMDEITKWHKDKLKQKNGIDSVPNAYKKYSNKKDKLAYERHLQRCVREGRFDDILTPVVHKNHKYNYF